MRKVQKDMMAAILARKAWQGGNTVITVSTLAHFSTICVYLHGHLIAEIRSAVDTVRFSLAGWNTPTTRSRLNPIIKCLLGLDSGVFQKDGAPMLMRNGIAGEIDAHEWYEFPITGDFNRAEREAHKAAVIAYAEAVRDARANGTASAPVFENGGGCGGDGDWGG